MTAVKDIRVYRNWWMGWGRVFGVRCRRGSLANGSGSTKWNLKFYQPVVKRENQMVFVYINGFLVTSFMLKRKKELLWCVLVCVHFLWGIKRNGPIIRSIQTVSNFRLVQHFEAQQHWRVMSKRQGRDKQPFYGDGLLRYSGAVDI